MVTNEIMQNHILNFDLKKKKIAVIALSKSHLSFVSVFYRKQIFDVPLADPNYNPLPEDYVNRPHQD